MKKTTTQFKKWWGSMLSIVLMLGGAGTNAQVYFTENFSTATVTTMPAGWTNVQMPSTTGFWDASDPGGRAITEAGFSSKFVIVDSDYLGDFITQDARLTTPSINLSTATNPYLQFSEQFRDGWGGAGVLEYSINGGSSWVQITTRGGADVGYPIATRTTIPLPAVAGQANVQFRWTFTGGYSWWWAIDAIEVAELGDPIAITGTSSNITTALATLSGNVAASGGSLISRSGILLSTTTNPVLGDPGIADSLTNPVNISGAYSLPFANLMPGSLYYYRAYAVSATDTGYGATNSFSTNSVAVIPSVVTTSATGIGRYGATIGGSISSDGGDVISASGIVYATTPNPQIGGNGVVDSVTIPSVSNGSFGFTLTGLTQGTKYYYSSYATNSVGTGYSVMDSFITEPIYSILPYSENFDGASTYWTASSVSGGINDWRLGTPVKSTINGAYSAPNAFVTKLNGNYTDGSDCAVLSPQFDFTAQTVDPILVFKHKFDEDEDPGYDGGVVEISINGGAWTVLDDNVGTGADYNTVNSKTWYNDGSGDNAIGFSNTFSGLSSDYASEVNGWITSSTALTGAAGAADVKIRFHFGADYYTDEGWAIDNIEIVAPTVPVVATSTVTNLTHISATLSGNISGNGLSAIIKSGIAYGTGPDPVIGDMGVIDSTTNPLAQDGAFSVNVTGLLPSTLYHYKAYATNAVGTTYGTDNTFTTAANASAPTVLPSTLNVRAVTATIGGIIPSNGGDAVTASGVVFSTATNPVIGGMNVVDSTTTPLTAMGQFSFMLKLLPNTKYYYKAYAINGVGTSYSTLDSFTTEPVVLAFPYSEDFDGVTTLWKTTAINGGVNDWVRGAPGKDYLDAAHSGTNAWVTKLTGTHSKGADGVVESPQFDFSAIASDPVLTFSNKFYTNFEEAGMNVEISINDGPYIPLDDNAGDYPTGNTFNGSLAWYDTDYASGNITGACFTGGSDAYDPGVNGWIQSSTLLTGAAGESNVRIRMRFSSYSWAGQDEGFAFDDVSIVEDVAPTILTLGSANITTTKATLSADITANGRTEITASGIVFGATLNPALGEAGVADSTNDPVVTEGMFDINIANLTLATTYHYRAYAINGVDTSYGADNTFITLATAIVPVVVNGTAANVEATTANLSANITSDGGEAITASGIVFSTMTNPVVAGVSVVDSSSNPLVIIGKYSFDITGLTSSTKYYYRAYAINNVGTGYSILDSFTTAPIISTFPYSQNFETGTAAWGNSTIGSGNNNWTFGTPNKSFLNGAHSGSYAWVTKLTDNYDGDHDAAVVSPQFDFSAFTTTPVVRFYHKFITEQNWDALTAEISINGGGWIKLSNYLGTGSNYNTDSCYAWYNHGGSNGPVAPPKFSSYNNGEGSDLLYSSNVNGWIQSAFYLTGAAGQPNVRFRFRFASDGGGDDEGWVIDDIEVVEVLTPGTPASSVVLSGIGAASTNIGWTNGDGEGRLVVAHLSTVNAIAPTNNKLYSANPVFGALDSTGLGNYIVHSGNAGAVTVIGLQEYTDYTYDVYEYNGKYMQIKFAPASSNNASTLPVMLTSFNATTKGNDALLNWNTATETNNSGFDIERSVDGRNFEKVNFVKGAGNSTKANSYNLTDAKAFAVSQSNVLYYRLKQVDFNGKYTYSKVIRVNKNGETLNGISVSPNPYSTDYSISLTANTEGKAVIEMTDMQGRTVSTRETLILNGANTLFMDNTSGLKAGVYFVRVSTNGESQMLKLVKN
jgi:hypothetical protein